MSDVTGSQRERYDKTIRRKEKLSGYFFDMSKIVFATAVIANIVIIPDNFTFSKVIIMVMGMFTTICLAWYGNRLLVY